MSRLKLLSLLLSLLLSINDIEAAHPTHTHKQEDDYLVQRESILSKEYKISVAGTQPMTPLEEQANTELKKYHTAEGNSGVVYPGYYAALHDVPHYLEEVKKLPTFKILQAMPKGALLHTHSIGMGSADNIYNQTYKKHLYLCCDEENYIFRLQFFKVPDDTCASNWLYVEDLRKNPFFDLYFRERLSMLKKIPYRDSKEISIVSKHLQQDIVGGVINYKPAFIDYVYQTLVELYEDGIRYVEIRTGLDQLYDLNGNTYNYDHVVKIYQDVLEDFQADYPKFYGLKLIYTFSRELPEAELLDRFRIYKDLKHKYGDFIAGLDLSGGEDRGKPLKDVANMLSSFKEQHSCDVQFYLHAGLTNWWGINADENLLDAIMLGTKRIGHGFALDKHPKLMHMVKEQNIAIEVAPLSDRVSDLYTDIRNHPAAVLSAFGVNYVLSNGNPGLWQAKGVSYDWYLAYMGFASFRDDLNFLKKMVLNSIEYSALNPLEKEELYSIWKEEWDIFIEKLANGQIPE